MSAEKMQDGELKITWPAGRKAHLTMEHDGVDRVTVTFSVERQPSEAPADRIAGNPKPATASPEAPVATTPEPSTENLL